VAAPYFFVAAGVAGAASGAASIANELNKDHPNPMTITVDVLLIASSIIGAGAAAGEIRAGVQASKLGFAARGQFITTKLGKFLMYSEFAASGMAGALISAQGVASIDAILNNSQLSRAEKISQVTRILAVIALQGGLIMLGYRNVRSTIKATSLVIDSNAAIALQKQAQGLPLQQGEQAIINRLKEKGEIDLLIADVTVAEIRGGKITFFGINVTVARNSITYQKVLDVLEKARVGSTKGDADRQIIADLFFC
jgi:hypothetical protein